MEGSVRKRKDKWYYSYDLATIDGKRKRIERVGGNTKKEALLALRMALNEYEQKGRHTDEQGISINDLLKEWQENYVAYNNAQTTREANQKIIDSHILPDFGGRRITTISSKELQKFINKKYAKNYSSSYLSRIKNVLTMSFDYAVNPCQYLKESPMIYIKIPKIRDKKSKSKEVLTASEFDTLIDYFKGSSKYLHLMIGFYTGCRIGEATALTWDDVDFKEQTLNLVKTSYYAKKHYYIGHSKTDGSVRKIKVGDTLINVLRDAKKKQMEDRLYYAKYYKDIYLIDEIDETGEAYHRIHTFDGYSNSNSGQLTNFVCLQENGALVTPGTFKKAPVIAREKLDIDFCFHKLRHTHATMLIEGGASIKAVQERLGHTTIKTTMDIYAHVTPRMEKELVDIIESQR